MNRQVGRRRRENNYGEFRDGIRDRMRAIAQHLSPRDRSVDLGRSVHHHRDGIRSAKTRRGGETAARKLRIGVKRGSSHERSQKRGKR